MSFQGAGRGFVTYVIANQPPVNNSSCTLVVLEDDAAGMLTLNVSFTDATYGQVQVGISVFNYSSSVTTYSALAYLMIGLYSQTPQGGWVSGSESSVSFSVTQAAGSGATTYTGSFDAANLTWIGNGNQDSLDIKFASYSFQVTRNLSPPSSDYQSGAGTGSMAYTLGSAPSASEIASATTVSYYNNGVLTGLCANLRWNDASQGNMVATITVIPFTGTGDYDSTTQNQTVLMMLTSASAVGGSWNNNNNSAPQVVFDVVYTESGYSAQLSGSCQGNNLVWQGPGSQANLTLNVTAFSFTLQLG